MRARTLLLALALGALPALIALPFDLPRFTSRDLLIPSIGLLALLVLVRFLPAVSWRPRSGLILGAALGLSLFVTLYANARLQVSVSNDEQAYLMQAELFASGRLADSLPDEPNLWRWRQVYEDSQRGLSFAKYPAGTSLSIAPAVALGWPPLAPLFAGILDLLLLVAIARRLGLSHPALAALLLATSPFFLLVQTSFQSEVFTMPFVLAGYLALLLARESLTPAKTAAWAACVGACSGWIFLARPLTGVLFAGAAGIALIGTRARLRALVCAAAAGLPFLAMFLAANDHYTGDPLRTVYDLYANVRGPWFDATRAAPVDVYGNGDFFPMFLDRTSRWAVAFCGVLGGAVLGFWGVLRLRKRDGGAALLFAGLTPIAYSFHWYPGHWAYLGPLYCFESLGFLVLGALAVLADLPPRWRNAFLIVVAIAGPSLAITRWPAITAESDLRSAPNRVAREQAPPGAVVLLPAPSRELDALKIWTPSRAPFSADEVVFVRTVPGFDMPRLLSEAGLSGRPVFRFVHDAGPDGQLERLGTVP